MVDGDSKPFSIEHCRELLGSEADNLCEERITAIRDHADAMAHFIIDLFIEQDAAPAKDRALEEKRFVETVQLVLNRLCSTLSAREFLAHDRFPRLPDLQDGFFE